MPAARPLRIVLPGGSGQVGRMLAQFFQERGHYVTVLTRGPYTAPWQTVHWDGKTLGPWVETLEGADVCIHLSGRSVNCRYTERNRRELRESRIGPTRLLHEAFKLVANPPRVWMNASSATIYRHALDRDTDEATGEIGGGEMISRVSARSREMELDRSTRQGLGGCILPNSYAEHAQSRAAYLACLRAPRRQRLRGDVESGARRPRRHPGQWPAIRLLDSRDRTLPAPSSF